MSASSPSMNVEFFSATDTGRARSNNEDSGSMHEASALVVLADGMGGYNAGEVASGMATSFIKTELGRWLSEASQNASDTDVRTLRPELPEALADVLTLALQRRPELRYADGRQMAADLVAIADALDPPRAG